MSNWQEHGTTNKSDMCLWCGRKLRLQTGAWVDDPTAKDGSGKRFDMKAPKEKRGDYADGFFCGLRCGYQFGCAFAGFGKRLEPK